MAATIDLDAYFERIHWGGSAQPSYGNLAGLLLAHVSRIPFENLDVLLGRGIRLDLDGLQAKLITAKRGGYCFEHATLFASVLERLGYDLVRHTARVVIVMPRNEAPRAHELLTVSLPEGTFVVDPGFGGLTPRLPLPLSPDAAVRLEDDVHWLAREDDHWVLRAAAGEKVIDCWVSTLEHDNLVDFEVSNHYTATHPNSPMRHRLMLRAFTPDGRISIMNRDVTRWRNGVAERSQLDDRKALRELLADGFGFDLPEVEQLRVSSIPEWA